MSRCFYCGTGIEYGGETEIITTTQTYEFEYWECEACKRRFLVESIEEDEE